jgi:hypothetical protein
MINSDEDAQAERAQAAAEQREREANWKPMPIREVGGGAIKIEDNSAPTEVELIGEMARCMEQMPEAGRGPALRYLTDRFAPPGALYPMGR